MRISAQEEYGLRCLLSLARAAREGSASRTIEGIAQEQGMTTANVAKILAVLREGGIVDSVRGRTGGYALARSADEIRLSEAIAVLGGPLFNVDCFCEKFTGSGEICVNAVVASAPDGCSIRPVWNALGVLVDRVLSEVRLSELLVTEQGMETRVSEIVRSLS